MQRTIGSLILCVWILPLLVMGRTYYVSSMGGSDGNDGLSPETSFQTLGTACRKLAAGDTLSLVSGSHFYESLVFHSSGTPWKPIVVEGNGCVVSGLKDLSGEAWEAREGGVYFLPLAFQFGALMPYLIDKTGAMLPREKPDKLSEGASAWTKEGIYVRCRAGETPASLGLRGTCLVSGVVFNNNSYITVRNLISEYNANDGYNAHGYCRGLVFEQIVSRYNGDDGFSVHEDVEAVVRGGHFHHNNFGIQDINASRTLFQGLLVEDNRIYGVHFNGGMRSLEDSVVRNNAQQEIYVQGNSASHIGYGNGNPLSQGVAFLKNVVVLNGKAGLHVSGPARVTGSNLAILRCQEGIVLDKAGELHLQGSAVSDSVRVAVCLEGESRMFSHANAYFPARFLLKGQECTDLAAFQTATGQEEGSITERPRFTEQFLGRKRLKYGNTDFVLGPTEALRLPFAIPVPEAYTATARPKGMDGKGIVFDFEEDNLWNRVFPEPEKDKDGRKPIASAETSTEQASSGTHSVKFQVAFPQTNIATWKIKLFSHSLVEWKQEVHVFSFQLYGDGQGAKIAPRLRDATGKSFQGPLFKVDWKGWKRVSWNLDEIQPIIIGKEKSQSQNPPFEAIVDFLLPTRIQNYTFYLDDLTLQ